jgi:hypothetical protein
MPVWHASVSLRTANGQPRKDHNETERIAVRALDRVGGRHEWWFYNAQTGIGHLRVPLTSAEVDMMPELVSAGDDAGESGPRRRRTYPPRIKKGRR